MCMSVMMIMMVVMVVRVVVMMVMAMMVFMPRTCICSIGRLLDSSVIIVWCVDRSATTSV